MQTPPRHSCILRPSRLDYSSVISTYLEIHSEDGDAGHQHETRSEISHRVHHMQMTKLELVDSQLDGRFLPIVRARDLCWCAERCLGKY